MSVYLSIYFKVFCLFSQSERERETERDTERERERACAQSGRGRERRREKVPRRLCGVITKPKTRFSLMNHDIIT